MCFLKVEGVTKTYGARVALDGVSLRLAPGERVALLGPSGSGKTTLLRLIAGFEAPDAGRILLHGREVARAGRIVVEPEARGVGMVFQDLALWPHLTVEGNLAFGLRAQGVPRRERRRRIDAQLAMVELGHLGRVRPGELSGGERQRVALARALVLRPPLLVMDEPLTSLDRELKDTLCGGILRLHGELGFTLLHVTHDRDEAEGIGTRLVHLRKGRREAGDRAGRRGGGER